MNWFLIYLLSVSGSVVNVAVCIFLIVGLGCLFASIFAMTGGCDDERERAVGYVKRLATIAGIAAAVAALTPTGDSIMRAYLMVEGSKLVTAKNAEKVTDEIVKRVDKVIEQIGGKL